MLNMFLAIALCLFGAVVGHKNDCAEIEHGVKQIFNLNDTDCLYRKFLKKYEIDHRSAEDTLRDLVAFRDNLKRINELNSEDGNTAVFGITKFSATPRREFARKYLGLRVPKDWKSNATVAAPITYRAPPDSFDWREHNAVTPVNNQMNCGSCWAFSAMAALETAAYLKTGVLVPLSEQQLVDCDTNNNGCINGFPDRALEYLRVGAMSSDDYPYMAERGMCQFRGSRTVTAVQDVFRIMEPVEDNAKLIINERGPLIALLDASRMRHYEGGIDQPPRGSCQGNTNHAVTIVGYGEENGVPFWSIKNSWSEQWGERGYYRLVRGRGACRIDSNLFGCSVQ